MDGWDRPSVTSDVSVTTRWGRTSLPDMNPMTSPNQETSPVPDRATIRPKCLPESVWPYPLDSLRVGDHRLIFTDTGGPGPVLLFVHVGLWCLMWRDVIGRLTDRYRCITLDVPGSGLSDRTSRQNQTLDSAAQAIGTLIDRLDLRGITLVVHDLGGLATLAAVRPRLSRVAAVAAVNTFGWKPRGLMLPLALRLFGSAAMRELDAFTGLLPLGSSSRLGVGRRWSRQTRQAWRAGLRDRSSRRLPHRLFRDAARNKRIHELADASLTELADRPLMTVFGKYGDYFCFQRQWRRRHTDVHSVVVPGGFHFPMCDNPDLVAARLHEWHAARVREAR